MTKNEEMGPKEVKNSEKKIVIFFAIFFCEFFFVIFFFWNLYFKFEYGSLNQ